MTSCHKGAVCGGTARRTQVARCYKGSLVVLALALAVLAGCGGSDQKPTDVVLVTHDSFAISDDVRQAFEDESGLKLRILKAGDAGEVVERGRC